MAFVTKKIADEGSAEPFIARIWMGIWELAQEVLKTKLILKKNSTPFHRFQVAYEPLLDALRTSRTATKNIRKRWQNINRKLVVMILFFISHREYQ